ncbi:ABC transporter substrate-binding protein [Cellulomonas wangsupingiae]|uniref:ABC transporter substrate-binding protein n=1 Tax=Cellulomonas wangsupingiae TaxID=2968085 RepID=A0ABY5K8P2_9CELL|nr:ABC transporter substrate-binding protein [Cellulomonas wangsupingiae]MCC2336054.1 ABC transporter substrate-binding protein [Cellulomonas wangsupingiae]MCM0639636.1 ABC transporter substrate-binding protein [Cellulomonas wangsupingiae]UUI64778.1 ABC transporter substrate-binding protein [Cellulomonas wangsupingiae]
MRQMRKRAGVLAVGAVAALALTACTTGDGDTPGGTADGGAEEVEVDCTDFEQYGDLNGKTITIYAGIVAPEDTPYMTSFEPFEECTGATVDYQADKQFEQQILVRAQAGNTPDIAIVPQPGLLAQLVATGTVVPAPEGVAANVDEFFGEAWKDLGTVDGTFYAAPSGASVKSLVWYSPTQFEENGYEVPETLDDLMALTEQIAADGNNKPWCAGIASGEATGWPLTDWVEDFVLRVGGPDVYDQWVAHEIPFNSEVPTQALDAVGEYLKNPDFVNGGIGDVSTIATTAFQDAGLPIVDGQCSLHRMASFYAANFPEGTEVAEDGDVFAFYLPSEDTSTKPVLGAGEFVVSFADRPEVQALLEFWSTDTWANLKAAASSEETGGGWITANSGLDTANLVNPIDLLSAEILLDPASEFRFDGSDQMPAAVGTGAFWRESTAWITGQSTADTLTKIEAAWP